MTPEDRIPVAIIILWFVLWIVLLSVIVWAAPENTSDVRYIDAPMEDAHHRAQGGWR